MCQFIWLCTGLVRLTEDFEPCDIQHADEATVHKKVNTGQNARVESSTDLRVGSRAIQRLVDSIHHDCERLLVQCLAHRRQFVFCLRFGPRLDDDFPSGFDSRTKDCIREVLSRNAKEVTDFLYFGWRGDTCLFGSVLTELNVSDVKDDTDDTEDVILLFVREADRPECRLDVYWRVSMTPQLSGSLLLALSICHSDESSTPSICARLCFKKA